MAKSNISFRLPKHLTLIVIVVCCLSLAYGIMHDSRRTYDDLRMSAEMNRLFETNKDTSEDQQSRDYSDYQQYHEVDNLGDYHRDGRGEFEDVKESNDEEVRWKGWNYLDTSKDDDSSNHLQSNNEGWAPHDKTISLQFLDDDGRFAHSPPAWPHDEYFLQYPRPFLPTKTNFSDGESSTLPGNEPSHQTEAEKEYEWQRLRPKPLTNTAFIGPGFYDYSTGHTYRGPTHQAITDSSSTSVAVSGGGGGDVQVPNSVSESSSTGKYYPGTGYPGSGYPGIGYGGHHPQDYYKRKRLRLKIHPGLLAAPIAGFAAYKAVSAIASKPHLFELGWVNNKPEQIGGGGGWGWNPHHHPSYPPTQVLPYPEPYPVPVHVPVPVVPIHHPRPGVPQYPILRPTKSEDKKSSSSGWWNPFSALTPRFRVRKERKCCGGR